MKPTTDNSQHRAGFEMPVKIPTPSVLQKKHALAITIGLGAVVWFIVLSEWLLVIPNSIMTKRINVLFHSDTGLSILRLAGDTIPRQGGFYYVVHPLELYLWRPACRALYLLLGMFWPSEYAAVFAGRLLVAIIAGIGVGCLAFLAVSSGVKTSHCVLLFIMYLLFTANTIVALPEHFGVSNGLLSFAYIVPLVIGSTHLRTIMYVAVSILIGGTTITNVLFPLASLAHVSLKSTRLKIGLSMATVLAVVGMAIVLAEMRRSTGWLFLTFFNNRILHDPREAGMYAILSLVHPAIGPNPSVVEIYRGLSMVSYNPFTITRYSWIQGVGVIAWVTLLFRCARKGLQEDRTRPYVWLLLSWLLFNAILHNLWGDEFFLYSPHWSWALMGLILLGARHVSLRFIAAMVIPLVVAQIHTLLAIRSALRSITW